MASVREILRFLLRNGYTEARQTGSHLILKHSDRKTVVVPVHKGKDLPKGLLLRILKDAGFTFEDFLQS
jgi:predicted RNA binding protein YcfA (HicA-like mRNA interferase family)